MRTLLIILSVLVLTSCKTAKTTSNNVSIEQKKENLPIIELVSGHNSGFEEATQKVIKSNDELKSAWKTANQNYMKSPTMPEVDFSKYDLILVASGWKKSGGYKIEVKSALVSDNQIIIKVLETSPGSNCNNTTVITQPYQIIQLEKTGKDYIFKKEEKVIDCKLE